MTFDLSDLIHRDDIPMEVIEELEKKFPGKKLVFAGDIPVDKIPEELISELEARDIKQAESMIQGHCFECNLRISGYDPEDKTWRPPAGWGITTSASGVPKAWMCPRCIKETSSNGFLYSCDD